MKIKISNHPQFSEVEREFEFVEIKTDLKNFADIKGFVKYYINDNENNKITPLGFNPNGEYFELIANKNTLVNSKTGEYNLKGDTNEIDYIKNLLVNELGENLTVENLMSNLVISSVLKQDKNERFNK